MAKSNPLATAALVLLSLAVIGLFIVVILMMNKQLGQSGDMREILDEMAEQLAALKKQNESSRVCLTTDCVAVAGQVIKDMGLDEDPCQTFFDYACSGFVKNPLLPQDIRNYDVFAMVDARNRVYLKQIFEQDEILLSGEESEAVYKAQQQYKACLAMDESAGVQPVLDLINMLGSWTLTSNVDPWTEDSSMSLEEVFATVHRTDSSPFFRFRVAQDYKNKTANRILIDQGDRLFPYQSMYTDEAFPSQRPRLEQTILKLVEILDGTSNQTEMVQKMVDLEQKIGNAQDRDSSRTSVMAVYHLMKVQEVTDSTNGTFDVAKYLTYLVGREVSPSTDIIVYAPDYFPRMAKLLQETPREIIQNYIVFVRIRNQFSFLPKELEDVRNIFYGGEATRPDWDECMERMMMDLIYPTGAIFVDNYFSESDREEIQKMGAFVAQAFEDGLPNLGWIDPQTQAAALAKANLMVMKLGYPEWILDVAKLDAYYADFEITTSYFTNRMRGMTFSVTKSLELFDTVVDRKAWPRRNPASIEAYYNPGNNDMVFFSGILEQPFFDITYPRAMIYGAIGSLIAHEFTHGFDYQGRFFDGYGDLADWWQNSSTIEFEKRAQCFVDQYSNITTRTGDNIKGQNTLSENIADNGGLNIGYRAYKLWQEQSSIKDVILPGLNLTSDQLYFLGYAQMWCSKPTDDYLFRVLNYDNHSPKRYRADVALMNSPEFSSAYQCPMGSRMNPEHKCRLWF